ncbi:DUF4296 domain-containing protein [Flavobacterium dauae]|uniref:DUF4296 domain-containing protein n=1 Tax=Flavobacterium dauae TaxID=1563479 RepID=UPI0013EB03AB|nr:DUF4296 domain-containing protein [Flavobacterium dauae]WLD23116.1 DUF4296 domain-containing protein [Flavobacterium dauae]
MKNVISIFFLIILVGCSKTEKAEIPQGKMVDILYDLTVSSSARSTANRRDTIQYVVDYKQILKKHGIDSLKFVKAQKIYQQDPDVYAVIYDSVNKRIQKKLEEVRATEPDKEEEKLRPLMNVKDFKSLRRNKE